MAKEQVDAVVVGSGAAGSLIAAKLSQAGKKVLILEGGPLRTKESLISSLIWSRRLKWAGPAIETGGSAPLSVGFGAGWGTGGGALHQKDRHGFPLARVTHQFAPDSILCWQDGIKQGKAIFEAAGAKEVWASGRHQMHTMGGTIMGRSARESVANGYGQTHDVNNLFLAGPGLFPTTGAVNPTFTLTALALRTAQHVNNRWASFS